MPIYYYTKQLVSETMKNWRKSAELKSEWCSKPEFKNFAFHSTLLVMILYCPFHVCSHWLEYSNWSTVETTPGNLLMLLQSLYILKGAHFWWMMLLITLECFTEPHIGNILINISYYMSYCKWITPDKVRDVYVLYGF